MRRTATFPAARESVPSARQFVVDLLGGVPHDTLEAVRVIVSELTSNCVRHGASEFELTVEHTSGRILIEASDGGGGEPVMRSPGPTETSGRGLRIVDSLANSWGVVHRAGRGGKVVWASVSVPVRDDEEPGPTRYQADLTPT